MIVAAYILSFQFLPFDLYISFVLRDVDLLPHLYSVLDTPPFQVIRQPVVTFYEAYERMKYTHSNLTLALALVSNLVTAVPRVTLNSGAFHRA